MHEPESAVFTCEAAEQGGSAQQVGSAQQGGYMQQASYVQQSDYAQQGAGAAERLRAAGAGAATVPVARGCSWRTGTARSTTPTR